MICAQVLSLIDCNRSPPTFKLVQLKDVGAVDTTMLAVDDPYASIAAYAT